MSIPERNAGGPRGGRTFSWHKRPGWVCCFTKWEGGKIVQQMWVPPDKAERQTGNQDDSKRRPRGALAAERQSTLFD